MDAAPTPGYVTEEGLSHEQVQWVGGTFQSEIFQRLTSLSCMWVNR
jgi:hypothetical protein